MSEYKGVRINQQEVRALFGGTDGPLYKHLNRTAEQVRNRARELCPVKDGGLRGSIARQIRLLNGEPIALVGSNKEYAAAVHNGSRPHVIRAKKGKALSFAWASAPSGLKAGRNGKYAFKFVNHPGTTANPFLQKALDEVMARSRGK